MNVSETTRNFRIRLTFWSVGAVLGFFQAWLSRSDADDNIVTYLDIGHYFFHGRPAAIVNGFWSPLYSFLFGLTITLFRPSLHWEYPTVHLLLFAMFLFTMLCFDYFLRQLMASRVDLERDGETATECGWVWLTIGYTIFLWSTLQWTEVNRLTTDLLAAGFFYLSFGLLVKVSSGSANRKPFLYLGLALGFVYLTKFFLLPVCLLFLAITWLVTKQNTRCVLISASTFVVITAPFVTALSIQKGRLTFGEAAKYDYAVSVNRIPRYHWQGDASMPLAHPTRQIFVAPDTFEFKEPFKGTFPPQYDITYWYEGIKPQVRFRHELEVLGRNLRLEFATLNLSFNGILLPTLFLVYYETRRGWLVLGDIRRYWFLIVPCVATAILFAFVYYIPQYAASSFVVLLLCLFLSVIAPPGSRSLAGVAILYLVIFICYVGFPSLLHAFDVHPFHPATVTRPSYAQIAEAALNTGLKPGDHIASLNDSNFGVSEWAHLAGIRIVAEIPYISGVPDGDPYNVWNRQVNNFWNADVQTQKKVLQKLSQTGARAVISQDKPAGPGAARWLEIENTGYYLYWVRPADQSQRQE